MKRWLGPQAYWASDEDALLQRDMVHRWMSESSYWAQGRSRSVSDKAIDHSVCIGLYAPDGAQAGFCRWVTDGATFAWLCDVFVDPAHRGRGLGVFMVECALAHPEVEGVRLLLGTADAHGLYSRFGFSAPAFPERYMERRIGPPGHPSP